MKKKVMALMLCVAMLAICVVSGTLAYFTDKDAQENVFTVGNIDVTLYESRYHRGATGNSYLGITGQPDEITDDVIIADSETYADYLASSRLIPFDDKVEANKTREIYEACTVAKNAYVKNTGVNDAYVRVRYVFPADVSPYLFFQPTTSQQITHKNTEGLYANAVGTEETLEAPFLLTSGAKTIDGVDYEYFEATFLKSLAKDEMTEYSFLSKVWLAPETTQAHIAALNLTDAQFSIFVEVDAIQADGFADAETAFAAFDATP